MVKKKNADEQAQENPETPEVTSDPAEQLSPEANSASTATANDNDSATMSDDPKASEKDLADELLATTRELESAKDNYLRAQAEIMNVQRRAATDLEKARKYSIEQFATELLDVKESLEQACEVEVSDETDAAIRAMRDGVELTLKQLTNVFEKFSVEELNPQPGEVFDPQMHQAMTTQPSDEFDTNQIAVVFRKGYRLHDRLIRPAMVVVVKNPKQSDTVADDDESKSKNNEKVA